MKRQWLGMGLSVLAGAGAASPAAAEGGGPAKFSAAQIDAMLGKTTGSSLSATLPTGTDGPQVMVLRRTASGEAEIHERLDDVFVVRSGQATLTVGGMVSGGRDTAPGERRGGTINGGESVAIGAGDVLWIPAGTPHQVVIPEGGEVSYIVLKRAR